MKKIIWVYGQSATGKKTLINKLLLHDKKTMEELEITSERIIACENTIEDERVVVPKIVDPYQYDDTNMQENNNYFNRRNAINRRSCIMTDCLDFINSDNDILLIKGQDNDYWPGRGDIVKYFLDYFSKIEQLEIEVFMLTVQDESIWRKRIEKKEWFKNFKDKDEVMKNMIKSRLEQKHENAVIDAFSRANVPIIFVDSGEHCYSILNNVIVKGKK